MFSHYNTITSITTTSITTTSITTTAITTTAIAAATSGGLIALLLDQSVELAVLQHLPQAADRETKDRNGGAEIEGLL